METTKTKRSRRYWPWLLVSLPLVLSATAWWAVTQPWAPSGPPCPTGQADSARLEAHVRQLVEQYKPREGLRWKKLAAAADYIHAELEKTGARTSMQRFEASRRTYANVVARFGPPSEERIIVGAHYDSAEGGTPGADDNASGVAGLLELARLLAAHPPPVEVELVAFALEEGPYSGTPEMGSVVHARSLVEQRTRVRAMFSLEMIGFFSDAPGSQHFPLPFMSLLYPTTGNFITVVGQLGQGELSRKVKGAMRAATPLPVHSINAPPSVEGIDYSDHASYWAEGYPAVMITDTAFYRNAHYHTLEDRVETLDFARMAQVVRGTYCAVHVLAQP